MKILPIAKTDNLVVQNLNNEILIYNLVENTAFCLNHTSATVYQACDGKTSFNELKANPRFPEDLIYLTLSELARNGFIEIPSNYFSPLNGISRREAVKKVGLATMIALPVITHVVVPSAANAASGCLPLSTICTFDEGLQAGCCDGLRCDGSSTCVSCNPKGTSFVRMLEDDEELCNISDHQGYINMCCNSTSRAVVHFDGSMYYCQCA